MKTFIFKYATQEKFMDKENQNIIETGGNSREKTERPTDETVYFGLPLQNIKKKNREKNPGKIKLDKLDYPQKCDTCSTPKDDHNFCNGQAILIFKKIAPNERQV